MSGSTAGRRCVLETPGRCESATPDASIGSGDLRAARRDVGRAGGDSYLRFASPSLKLHDMGAKRPDQSPRQALSADEEGARPRAPVGRDAHLGGELRPGHRGYEGVVAESEGRSQRGDRADRRWGRDRGVSLAGRWPRRSRSRSRDSGHAHQTGRGPFSSSVTSIPWVRSGAIDNCLIDAGRSSVPLSNS